MNETICGLDCTECEFKEGCKGCKETNGRPFGGKCIVAECCKENNCGKFPNKVCSLKKKIIREFNHLGIKDMEKVTDLYALVGSFVNMEYILPNGEKIKLLDDNSIYLGNQIKKKNSDKCYGLIADEEHLLVCEYGENGKDSEIVVYKRRGNI
jgi:hypothetical protein